MVMVNDMPVTFENWDNGDGRGLTFEYYHEPSELVLHVWVSNDRQSWAFGARENWFDFGHIHKETGFTTVHEAMDRAIIWANNAVQWYE